MNKTYEYRNRYNDNIVFVEEEPNVVYMYGGKYLRLSFDADNTDTYIMADPSGGPFVELGCNFLGPWEAKRVVKIEKSDKPTEEDDETIIKFTLE
jgi:hypothetical protein